MQVARELRDARGVLRVDPGRLTFRLLDGWKIARHLSHLTEYGAEIALINAMIDYQLNG